MVKNRNINNFALEELSYTGDHVGRLSLSLWKWGSFTIFYIISCPVHGWKKFQTWVFPYLKNNVRVSLRLRSKNVTSTNSQTKLRVANVKKQLGISNFRYYEFSMTITLRTNISISRMSNGGSEEKNKLQPFRVGNSAIKKPFSEIFAQRCYHKMAIFLPRSRNTSIRALANQSLVPLVRLLFSTKWLSTGHNRVSKSSRKPNKLSSSSE